MKRMESLGASQRIPYLVAFLHMEALSSLVINMTDTISDPRKPIHNANKIKFL